MVRVVETHELTSSVEALRNCGCTVVADLVQPGPFPLERPSALYLSFYFGLDSAMRIEGSNKRSLFHGRRVRRAVGSVAIGNATWPREASETSSRLSDYTFLENSTAFVPKRRDGDAVLALFPTLQDPRLRWVIAVAPGTWRLTGLLRWEPSLQQAIQAVVLKGAPSRDWKCLL